MSKGGGIGGIRGNSRNESEGGSSYERDDGSRDESLGVSRGEIVKTGSESRDESSSKINQKSRRGQE